MYERKVHRKNQSCILIRGEEIRLFKYFYISAFCRLTDRLAYEMFIEKMLMYERNVHRKYQCSILIRGEENPIFIIFTVSLL